MLIVFLITFVLTFQAPDGAVKRLGQSLFALLLAIDVLIESAILFFPWLIFARFKPTGRETISALVGTMALKGWWIGRALQVFINWLMENPLHCQQAAAYEKPWETPLN